MSDIFGTLKFWINLTWKAVLAASLITDGYNYKCNVHSLEI